MTCMCARPATVVRCRSLRSPDLPSTGLDSSAWTGVGRWWQCPGHDRVRPSRAPQRAFRARRSHRCQLRGRRPRQRVSSAAPTSPGSGCADPTWPTSTSTGGSTARCGSTASTWPRWSTPSWTGATPTAPRCGPTDAGGLPRGVGRRRAALGRDRRAGPRGSTRAAARARRRRVVVHRDAAPSRVRHRRLDPAGDARRPGAVGPARPAVGRDARHAGHPARPRGPARRSTRCSRCGPTGWRPYAGWSTTSPTSDSPPRPSRSTARAGRPPRSFPVRECLLDHPQRGVGAPPVRRARPRGSGGTWLTS